MNWKTYCSLRCQSVVKNKYIKLMCARPSCNKIFERQAKQINRVKRSYCSMSCSAKYNNSLRNIKVKKCANKLCSKRFFNRNKHCSLKCSFRSRRMLAKEYSQKVISTKYNRNLVIREIKDFYKKNSRIPVKRELQKLYRPARTFYGSWNKAIIASGFEPNPVMFAKKCIAIDGHKCNSLAEKIIDDWFYNQGFKHETNVRYPGGYGMTVDFIVRGYWIEYFGLYGNHKRYDQLRRRKLNIARRYGLKLIEVYPDHLFPENKLNKTLRILLN